MDVSIHGPTETINLYNIYVHPGAMNKGITLANYLKIISNSSNKLVLLGDFNCKNVIWVSNETNTQGDIVSSLMEKFKLFCLNDGSGTFLSDCHHTWS